MKHIVWSTFILVSLITKAYGQQQTCCPEVNSVKAIIDKNLLELNNEVVQDTLNIIAKKGVSAEIHTNLPFLRRNIFQHNDGKLCSYRINSTTGPLIYTIPSYPCPKR